MHHCCLLYGCLDKAVSISLPDMCFIYYYLDFQILLALKIWRQRQLINKWNQQAVWSQQLKKDRIANTGCNPAPVVVRVELPGAQVRVAGDGWSVLPAHSQNDVSSAVQISMQKTLTAAATLLCTFYTKVSDGCAAIPGIFRIGLFWTVYSGFSVCLRASGCMKGIFPIHRWACICHLGFRKCLVQFKD